MHDTWMKAGEGGTAHWIKISGGYFVTACAVVLARDSAVRVIPARFRMKSGGMKRFYFKPAQGEVCPLCVGLAKQKAQRAAK